MSLPLCVSDWVQMGGGGRGGVLMERKRGGRYKMMEGRGEARVNRLAGVSMLARFPLSQLKLITQRHNSFTPEKTSTSFSSSGGSRHKHLAGALTDSRAAG